MTEARTEQTRVAVRDDWRSRLVLQRGDDLNVDYCAYFSLANIFALRGLQPPDVHALANYMKWIGGHRDWEGVGTLNLMTLLEICNFPGVPMWVTPPLSVDPFPIIKSAVEQGWLLLLTYCYVVELSPEAAVALFDDVDFAGVKVWATHSVIPYHVNAESKELDCIIGWEAVPVDRLKWKEVMMPDSYVGSVGAQPVGFARGMIQIWPYPDAGKADWSWLDSFRGGN